MAKVRFLGVACALAVLAVPRAQAITLQQLLIPGTEVTVGCLKFSNFGAFSVTGYGSPTITTGFALDGSNLDLQFVQISPFDYEVLYSGFDITNLGPGLFERTLTFAYDVEILSSCLAVFDQVDAMGIFGASCSPPLSDPASNSGNAFFTNTFYPDAGLGPISLNLIGTKTNLYPLCEFQDMESQVADIGPASKIHVVKEFTLNLLITDGFPGTLYNAHVSAYKQSYHVIPEPSSAILLLLGGAVGSLYVVRRRRT
jgi:hypothetical protein